MSYSILKSADSFYIKYLLGKNSSLKAVVDDLFDVFDSTNISLCNDYFK